MDEDTPKIKKFHVTNNSLKELGEVIANEKGRRIIMALVEKEMYINEISKTLDIPVGLVLYHVQKLEKLGMLEITEKPISKKTKDHRFIKINTDIFLEFTPEDDSKLKRIFKEGVKFASIGLAGITTWFISTFHFASVNEWRSGEQHLNNIEITPLVISLIMIIVALVTERIYSIIKKKG